MGMAEKDSVDPPRARSQHCPRDTLPDPRPSRGAAAVEEVVAASRGTKERAVPRTHVEEDQLRGGRAKGGAEEEAGGEEGEERQRPAPEQREGAEEQAALSEERRPDRRGRKVDAASRHPRRVLQRRVEQEGQVVHAPRGGKTQDRVHRTQQEADPAAEQDRVDERADQQVPEGAERVHPVEDEQDEGRGPERGGERDRERAAAPGQEGAEEKGREPRRL